MLYKMDFYHILMLRKVKYWLDNTEFFLIVIMTEFYFILKLRLLV